MERSTFTFGDYEISRRLDSSDHVLLKIDKLVDWERFRRILSKVELRNSSYYGRDSYAPMVMFRIMLVKMIYNLSDQAMEDQLKVNILFMRFCQLSLNSPVPDESTICRWRARFVENGIFESLFADFIEQLESKGLELRVGGIVDATLIQAHARPQRKIYEASEPTGDEENIEDIHREVLTMEESKDSEARWLKKGKKSIYGYKDTVVTSPHGIVTSLITTPANISDVTLLEECVKKAKLKPGSFLGADKGFDSKHNREVLQQLGLVDGIMRKKKKGVVNDFFECMRKLRNKSISKIRYVVERTFGSLKLRYGFQRTRYIGLVKTHNYNLLGALAFNMVRCLNLSTG